MHFEDIDERLQGKCLDENRRIIESGLSTATWGNFSLVDRRKGLVYIKPSGVDVRKISHRDVSVVDIRTMKCVAGLKPSIDLATHVALYESWEILSVCHTHSLYATSFAQAPRDIGVMGTTHADTFPGPVRVLHVPLGVYEKNDDSHEKRIGQEIVDNFDVEEKAALLAHHGVFTWSKGIDSVDVARDLEEIAKLNHMTHTLNDRARIPETIRHFHWDRKHGKNPRYGQ